MSIFLLPVQAALYTRLAAQLSGVGIYDDAPDMPEGSPDDQFPYLILGEDMASQWDTDDVEGAIVTATLHVWTRTAGKAEVKTILGNIYTALHRQHATLSATGYRFVDCLHEFSQVIDTNDGATRHGIVRYRITMEKE